MVPDSAADPALTPLSGKGGLPVTRGRDQQDDPRGRLVQQPRQPWPLDDVALRSDGFDDRFADDALPCAQPDPLSQDYRGLPRVAKRPYGTCPVLRGLPAPAEHPRARVPSVPPASSGRAEALGEGIHAGEESIGDGDLAPAGDSELLAQDVGMGLHGARGDAQLISDLLVREALGDELDDLTLAVRERRCSLRERLVHAAELTTCCTRATFTERRIRVVYSRG